MHHITAMRLINCYTTSYCYMLCRTACIDDHNELNFYNRFDEINLKCPGSDHSIILVGAKLDLQSKRAVNVEEAEQMAASKDVKYFECSSKENINVKEAMDSLVESIIQNMRVTCSSTESYEPETESKSCFSYC